MYLPGNGLLKSKANKKYTLIDIPTKPYIKEYVFKKLGDLPILDHPGESISDKLSDLMWVKTNERDKKFKSVHYTTSIKIYVDSLIINRAKHTLNETNAKSFNLFLEREIKESFHSYMDMLYSFYPSFINNLPEVRKKLGISQQAWPDASMKKEYYRYRLRQKEMGICKEVKPEERMNLVNSRYSSRSNVKPPK